MSTIEQNSGVNSKELLLQDDWMDALKKQAEEKKKALEMPTRLDVSGKTYKLWNKDWKYFGSWLEWWNKKMNCPWWWEWIFKSTDGKVEVKWLWNEKWTFVGTDVTIDWKIFKNKKTILNNNNPSEMLELECSSTVDWKAYDCKLNKNFEISEITYAWITLMLMHEGEKSYLVNKAGRRLPLWSVSEDLATIRIAKCISIVKNAIENGEKSGLEYFETDVGGELQADYSGTWWDTDLLRSVSINIWISADRLVSWLNASRYDWGL